MKKIITLILLCINIFASDTVFIEKEKLDAGFWKGNYYTGNIDLEGYPQGEGTIYRSDDINTLVAQGLFKDGSLQKGKIDFGSRKAGESGESYNFSANGDITSDYHFQKGSEVSLKFNDESIKKYGKKTIKGRIVELSYDRVNIDSITEYIQSDSNNLKIRKCVLSIFQLYDLKNYYQNLNSCKVGPFYQEWYDGLKFEGYITSAYYNQKTQYDGNLIWPDGLSFNYKGEWKGQEEIEKIKKRLDLLKKQKNNIESETSQSISIEKIKPIDEYNPGVIVEDKKLSKEYKEKELAPINME